MYNSNQLFEGYTVVLRWSGDNEIWENNPQEHSSQKGFEPVILGPKTWVVEGNYLPVTYLKPE